MGGDWEQPTGSMAGSTDLLTQHQRLLSMIEQIERLLSPQLTDHSETLRLKLGGLLAILIQELETHFEAERKSLDEDFDDDPELRAVFQELDEEHPLLLERYASALKATQEGLHLGEVSLLIRHAIEGFREHEAREDALFVST